MLPTEQFSGDATPDKQPWTPPVWKAGPDSLVAQAQHALWGDRSDVEGDALGGSGTPAMSGDAQYDNEQEQLINVSTPGDSPSKGPGGTTRGQIWRNSLKDLRTDRNPEAGDQVDTSPDHDSLQ